MGLADKVIITSGTPKRNKMRLGTSSHSIKIRPRYCETDQGGVVHHSVYPIWFEMGRTELLRANGVAYKDLEQAGIFFVMARLEVKYRQPAMYDEELELITSCINVTASKIEHCYQLKRLCDGTLLAEGSSTLACLGRQGKIQRVPESMYPVAAYEPRTESRAGVRGQTREGTTV
jgi:acyl-CoA thioester hydrolase